MFPGKPAWVSVPPASKQEVPTESKEAKPKTIITVPSLYTKGDSSDAYVKSETATSAEKLESENVNSKPSLEDAALDSACDLNISYKVFFVVISHHYISLIFYLISCVRNR